VFVKIHPKLLVKFAAHQGRACTDARPMEQLGSARHLWLRMQPSGATRAGAPASPTRTPKNASTEHPPLFSDLLPPRDTGPLEALRLCVQKSCTVLHMPHAGRNHQVSSQHREAASARKGRQEEAEAERQRGAVRIGHSNTILQKRGADVRVKRHVLLLGKDDAIEFARLLLKDLCAGSECVLPGSARAAGNAEAMDSEGASEVRAKATLVRGGNAPF